MVPGLVAVLTRRWMDEPSVGIITEILLRLGPIGVCRPRLGGTSTALWAVTVESIRKGTPCVMLLLLAALRMVPRLLLGAAAMDGAPVCRKLRHVIRPQIRVALAVAAVPTFILTVPAASVVVPVAAGHAMALPGIVAVATRVMIHARNEDLHASTFIMSQRNRTLPLGLSDPIGQSSTDRGMLMAGGVVTSGPILPVVFVRQKRLVSGIGGGAAKG